MHKPNQQFMWIGLLFLTAIIVIFSFATVTTNTGNHATAAIVYNPDDYCNDGTPLNKCSDYSLGNRCIAAKEGPELRFSEKCY